MFLKANGNCRMVSGLFLQFTDGAISDQNQKPSALPPVGRQQSTGPLLSVCYVTRLANIMECVRKQVCCMSIIVIRRSMGNLLKCAEYNCVGIVHF